MEGIERRLYAVTLPFLAHSHFNAILNLSRLLATRGVTVICVTLPSNRQILLPRVQRWGDLPLYFHDLSVTDSPLPPDRQIVNNISGDELPMIFDIIHKMKEPLKGFMAELTGREYYESRGFQLPDRLIIIYDMFMGWSSAVAAEFGVQSFMFYPGSVHSWPPGSTLGDKSASPAEKWKAEALPEGYERRLEGRCRIETCWAPQAAILAHEATGAFITHCGWNSVLESVAAGVPMIALPLHSEQPLNAMLLAKEVKVAVELKRSDGVANRGEVERVVRRVMAAEEMKRRVKEVSVAAVAAVSKEGGAVWKNVDSFINACLSSNNSPRNRRS